MNRIFYQVYVRNSDLAIETYHKAFNATILNQLKTPDGINVHTELDVYGQVLALSELNPSEEKALTGNTMQFCLQFEKSEKDLITKAYEILKLDANINYPLGECFYSVYMTDITDAFGVRWCLFI